MTHSNNQDTCDSTCAKNDWLTATRAYTCVRCDWALLKFKYLFGRVLRNLNKSIHEFPLAARLGRSSSLSGIVGDVDRLDITPLHWIYYDLSHAENQRL